MLYELLNLFFPAYCVSCEKVLSIEERFMCKTCEQALVYTAKKEDQRIKAHFEMLFPICRAYSLLYFQHQKIAIDTIHALKYKNKPLLGVALGESLGEKLPKGIFDAVVPIPLHSKKKKARGYNQSEKIAQGIATILSIPIVHPLYRKVNNPSQAQLKKSIDRLQNTVEIFAMINSVSIKGKHILLVDDVITSGATLFDALRTLDQVKDIRVSLACIAYAG